MAEIWTVNRELLAGGVQRWDAYLLGQDEYGTWLCTSSETPIRDEQDRPVDTLQAEAQLFSHGTPWVASWRQDGSVVGAVTSPVEIDDRSIRYVDLGLHHRAGEGAPGRDVTQTYDDARAAGLVAGEQDREARETLSGLRRRIAERTEPFGQVGRKWFTRITRNELHFVGYDPQWPEKFAAARDELLPVLPGGSRVEHFGSTSVPGLSAKDCIDIAVAVPDLQQVDEVIPALESLGYEARPDAFKDPGHVFFRRLTDGRRSHHLHLYREGHRDLIGVLALRDLLRSDSQARRRYQAVKESLAEANPHDRAGYAAGKDAIARELLELALIRQRQG